MRGYRTRIIVGGCTISTVAEELTVKFAPST